MKAGLQQIVLRSLKEEFTDREHVSFEKTRITPIDKKRLFLLVLAKKTDGFTEKEQTELIEFIQNSDQEDLISSLEFFQGIVGEKVAEINLEVIQLPKSSFRTQPH